MYVYTTQVDYRAQNCFQFAFLRIQRSFPIADPLKVRLADPQASAQGLIAPRNKSFFTIRTNRAHNLAATYITFKCLLLMLAGLPPRRTGIGDHSGSGE